MLPRALQRRALEQDASTDGSDSGSGIAVLGDLLAAIRQLVAGRNELHQGLFRCRQAGHHLLPSCSGREMLVP